MTTSPSHSPVGQVSYEGIAFTYDFSLAAQIQPIYVPAHLGPEFSPWEQTPAHLVFQFGEPYTASRDLYWQGFTAHPAPVIFIFPSADFPPPDRLGWDGQVQVEALKTLLQDRPETVEGALPLLPLTNAGQSFHARMAYIDFAGGSGVCFLTQYTQEQRTINNQELIYTFQGLTSDGAFYISALLPVSARSLPPTFDVVEEEVPNFWASFGQYLNEAVEMVNHLPEEDFDPPLATFDALFASLSFPFVDPTATPPPTTPTAIPTDFLEPTPSYIFPTPLPTLSVLYNEYTSQEYGLVFEMPAHWQKVAEDHYQGTEGFFQISPYQEVASGLEDSYSGFSSRGLRACLWELNAEPGRYGSQPDVRTMLSFYGESRCLIFPGEDAHETAAAMVFDTEDGSLAILRADLAQMQRIANTLYNAPGYSVNLSQRPVNPRGVQPALELETGSPRPAGSLSLNAYRLFPAEQLTPDEDTLTAITGGLDGIVADSPVSFVERLEEDNAILAVFGYYLESGGEDTLNLYQGEALLRENLSFSHLPLTISGDEDAPLDFALTMVEPASGQGWLLRPSGLEPWNFAAHLYSGPVFVGDKMTTVEHLETGLYSQVSVTMDGENIYRLLYPLQAPFNLRLMAWDASWVLEVDGTLIVDGVIQNLELDCGEIFGWTLLDGQPFYFFEKDGMYGVSYAGGQLDVQYEDMLRSGPLGPQASDTKVRFFAQKDGKWYYVVIEDQDCSSRMLPSGSVS